jgi:NADH dehydrogenase
MKSVDPRRKLVIGAKKQYPYDTLVIAIGVVTTYFGISGMATHSFGIKTVDEVHEFKKHLHSEIVADQHMDKNYVIIGGGLTGIELAGSLAGYLRDIAVAHQVQRAKINIKLIEAAPRLVPHLSPTASKIARRRLEALGVKVLTHHKVEAIKADVVTVEGVAIPTETAVWTSGVTNNPFFAAHPDYFRLSKDGRVEVNSYLGAYDHIYVLGDNASTPHAGRASTALHDARFIAKHLARVATNRPLEAYRPLKVAASIPIGSKWAYTEKYGIYTTGLLGYAIRRLTELTYLKALLPHNRAMSTWHAYTVQDEECELCRRKTDTTKP